MNIILLPSLFGVSRSETLRLRRLTAQGHQVHIVDPYQNQGFSRPWIVPFMMKNRGKDRQEKAINDLAFSLRDEVVFETLDETIGWLGTPAVLHGVSIGGCLALRFAECYPSKVSAVVAVSSRLVYPEGRPEHKIEPDPAFVRCPQFLAYGSGDSCAEIVGNKLHGNRIQGLPIRQGDYYGGHGFCNRFAQGWIPNPFWNEISAAKFDYDVDQWLASLTT